MARFISTFDEFDKQLGMLVRKWGDLELAMANMFAALAGEPEPQKLSIFYSIVSNKARADLLRIALMGAKPDETARTEASKLIDKFQSLNSARNRYVHGVYGQMETYVGHIDLTSPSWDSAYSVGEISPLNGAELKNHIEAVKTLQMRAIAFVTKHYPRAPQLAHGE